MKGIHYSVVRIVFHARAYKGSLMGDAYAGFYWLDGHIGGVLCAALHIGF